jgi:hypothetical protein
MVILAFHRAGYDDGVKDGLVGCKLTRKNLENNLEDEGGKNIE